jgi:hypothetical protein
VLPEPSPLHRAPRAASFGAAAVCTLLGGIVGAWLYARWEHERNKPLHRLQRLLDALR